MGTVRPVSGDATLRGFARAIVEGDRARVSELVGGAPELALVRLAGHVAEEYFLDEIRHMVYSGDTALHLAAACYDGRC